MKLPLSRDDPVDRLVEELRRPIYNYNMSMHGAPSKRFDNAKKEIDEIVEKYVSDKDLKRFGS